jgi:hypothetical protein
MFAARSRLAATKDPEFIMKTSLFPLLNNNSTESLSVESTESYKSKIQKFKEQNIVEVTVPAGYIILTKNRDTHLTPKIMKPVAEYNEYYNPWISRLIMENRVNQREELNDILGDISPYWNMEIPNEDDYLDFDESGYTDDDDDYVEDW